MIINLPDSGKVFLLWFVEKMVQQLLFSLNRFSHTPNTKILPSINNPTRISFSLVQLNRFGCFFVLTTALLFIILQVWCCTCVWSHNHDRHLDWAKSFPNHIKSHFKSADSHTEAYAYRILYGFETDRQ